MILPVIIGKTIVGSWRIYDEESSDVQSPYAGNMKRLNNVNYSASVTYALQALGEMFNRPDFKEEARIVASDLKNFLQ